MSALGTPAPKPHPAVKYTPGVAKPPEWREEWPAEDRDRADVRIAMLEAQVHYLSGRIHDLIWRGVQ